MKKNIVVGQSGGPSCAINASLTGVISAGIKSAEIGKVYGSFNGIEGIINNNLIGIKLTLDTICYHVKFSKSTITTRKNNCQLGIV